MSDKPVKINDKIENSKPVKSSSLPSLISLPEIQLPPIPVLPLPQMNFGVNTDDTKKISKKNPLSGLSDPRIEKVELPSNIKQDLKSRSKDSVDNIKFEVGFKKGDALPNYILTKDGKLQELIPPDKSIKSDSKSIVIMVEPQKDGKLSSNQSQALNQLVVSIKNDYTNAEVSDSIPTLIQQAIDGDIIPVKLDQKAIEEQRAKAGKIQATAAAGQEQWGGEISSGQYKGQYSGSYGGNGSLFNNGQIAYSDNPSASNYRAPVDFAKYAGTALDMNNPVDRVAALISSNEGNPTSINWNDNGYGVSVGMFQANQKVGELPMLFEDLASTPEGYALLVKIFGAKLAKEIKDNPNIVRELDFQKDNKLGHELEQLVQSKPFQQLQLQVLREKVVHASEVAKKYGITSTEGVAIVADAINQWGESGALRFIKKAENSSSQLGKIKAMVAALSETKYGSRYVHDRELAANLDMSSSQKFTDKNSSVQDA